MLELCGVPIDATHAGMGSHGRDLFRPYRGVSAKAVSARRPILLHRNPIDTSVSMFFQIDRRDRERTRRLHPIAYVTAAVRGNLPPRSIEAFVRHPRFGVEGICRFNRDWMEYLPSIPGSLVLSYEALRESPVEQLGSLLEALGHRSALPVAEVVQQGAFDVMKRRELDGELKGRQWGRVNPADPDSAKVRRGIVRGYRDYLGDDVVLELQAIAQRYGFHA